MHTLHKVAFIFVIVGGLNWGLIGALNFNLVTYLFGQFAPFVETIVYWLVGASAIVLAVTHGSSCCVCNDNCNCAVPPMTTKSMVKKASKKRK
jgi:uncharacterized protein